METHTHTKKERQAFACSPLCHTFSELQSNAQPRDTTHYSYNDSSGTTASARHPLAFCDSHWCFRVLWVCSVRQLVTTLVTSNFETNNTSSNLSRHINEKRLIILPAFKLATPPGFTVNHVPKGNLKLVSYLLCGYFVLVCMY